MNTDKYFKLARNASRFSDYPKIKIGAVVVCKNKVISVGWNTTQSHPLQKHYNKYRNVDGREYDVELQSNGLHAEMMAIRHLKGDLSKCSIFVYREYKDGSTGISKPCQACMKAMEDIGIKNIYYTTENGYNYERIG